MTAMTTYYYQVHILVFRHAAHFIGRLAENNMLILLGTLIARQECPALSGLLFQLHLDIG